MATEYTIFDRKFENTLQGGLSAVNEVFEYKSTKLADRILDAVIVQNTCVGAMRLLAGLNERRSSKFNF